MAKNYVKEQSHLNLKRFKEYELSKDGALHTYDTLMRTVSTKLKLRLFYGANPKSVLSFEDYKTLENTRLVEFRTARRVLAGFLGSLCGDSL